MNATTASAPLIVVSGPSGVGKTTVVERLLTQMKDQLPPLRRAITATTRPPRPGEHDGRDYHFWSREQFEKAIAEQQMLEYAIVFGNDYYGTPKSEVEPYLAQGIGVILVIDVQGAARVRELFPACLSIFIAPPSLAELEARLRGRNDTAEERIARRLRTAHQEMAEAGKFQHQIVNRDLEQAVRELQQRIGDRFHCLGGSLCSKS
ncbi:MAG: guanylate kinase [Gemmataceae bacterium]|nr:guanylate kinase [Gemmata sp.]MDW8197046.1 guanylate kinase [Gemmataceae bacterium]